MTKNKIIFSVLVVLIGLSFANIANAQVDEYFGYPQITEQWCDLDNHCPLGLECNHFPGIGLRCSEPNPCSWFNCPGNTECFVRLTYPGQVVCFDRDPRERPFYPNDGDDVGVVFDLLTRTVIDITRPDKPTESRNVSLWEDATGNRGILDTPNGSAEHFEELFIEDFKLFMETSVGRKKINVLPEDAMKISGVSNIALTQEIELKEKSEKPVYSVIGVREARILFIFPIRLEIKTIVSAETAQIISVEKPWWSFLAW